MKNILITLTGILLSLSTFADCRGYGMSVFPSGNTIKQNSILVLETYANSQEIINDLNSKYPIYLESGDKKVSLKVDEIYVSQFKLTQVILKPTEKLISGLDYKLVIENLPEPNRLKRYNKSTDKYEDIIYRVEDSIDTEKPILISKPKEIDKTYAMFGCGPSMAVYFNLAVKDSSELIIKTTVKSLKSNKETTFFIVPENNQIRVGHGMCSGAFTFREGDKYEVEFSYMDASGNITIWEGERIKFTKPSDKEWEAWRNKD